MYKRDSHVISNGNDSDRDGGFGFERNEMVNNGIDNKRSHSFDQYAYYRKKKLKSGDSVSDKPTEKNENTGRSFVDEELAVSILPLKKEISGDVEKKCEKNGDEKLGTNTMEKVNTEPCISSTSKGSGSSSSSTGKSMSNPSIKRQSGRSDNYVRSKFARTDVGKFTQDEGSVSPDYFTESSTYKSSHSPKKRTLPGDFFQFKLIMLFMKQANDAGYECRLATEVDDGDSFDDIVFAYKKIPLQWNCVFIQVKHKSTEATKTIKYSNLKSANLEGDFCLVKYFLSYCSITRSNKFSNSLKEYMICTNAVFDRNDDNIGKKLEEKDDLRDKLPIMINCRAYRLKPEVKNDLELTIGKIVKSPDKHKKKGTKRRYNKLQELLTNKNTFDQLLTKFIDDMIFYMDLPDETEVGKLVEKKLGEKLNLIDCNLLYCSLESIVFNWLKSSNRDDKNSSTVLSNDDISDIIDDIYGKYNENLVTGMSEVYPARLESYNVAFTECLSEIEAFIGGGRQQICHIVANSARLGSIMVLQCLKKVHAQSDSYIFVHLKTLTNNVTTKKKILKAYSKEKSHNMLIVECQEKDRLDREERDLCSDLKKSLCNKDKKVVLISLHENNFSPKFKENHGFICINFVYNFDQLAEGCKQTVMDTELNFQGKTVLVKDLMDLPLANATIDANVLFKIIKGKLTIGNSDDFSLTPDEKALYIKRSFRYQRILKTDFKKSKCIEKYLFFITNANVTDFSKINKKFVASFQNFMERELSAKNCGLVLTSEKSKDGGDAMFKQVVDKCNDNDTVIWLEAVSQHFKWKDCKGNFKDFQSESLITNKKFVDLKEDNFVSDFDKRKIVLLANNPGVGKSTILGEIAGLLKDKYKTLWIIRINLNEFTDKDKINCLDNININEMDTDDAVRFLIDMVLPRGSERCKNRCYDFERLFLEKSLMDERPTTRVVILLDAFDEISPSYNANTIALIKGLGKTRVSQLWVTTRLVEMKHLEESLQVPALCLNNFSEEDRTEFLKKNLEVRKSRGISMDLSNMKKALRNFNRALNENRNMGKAEPFLLIPHNLKMLVEILLDDVNETENIQNSLISGRNINLLFLYERFINYKWDVYNLGKAHSKRGNEAQMTKDIVFWDKIWAIHEELAIKKVVPAEYLSSLPKLNKMSKFKKMLFRHGKDAIDELTRLGLVNNTHFLHSSYAEFFVSRYFMRHIKNEDVLNLLMEKILVESKYSLVCMFLNYQLRDVKLSEYFSLKSDSPSAFMDMVKNGLECLVHLTLDNFDGEDLAKLLIPEDDSPNALFVALQNGHTKVIVHMFDCIRLNCCKISLDSLRKLLFQINDDQTILTCGFNNTGKGETGEAFSALNALFDGLKQLKKVVPDFSDDTIRQLILLVNKNNKTVLHIAFSMSARSFSLAKLLDCLKDGSNEEVVRELIAYEDNNGKNVLVSLTVPTVKNTLDLIRSLFEWISQNSSTRNEDILHLMTKSDNNNHSFLHIAAQSYSNNIESLFGLIGDHVNWTLFKQLSCDILNIFASKKENLYKFLMSLWRVCSIKYNLALPRSKWINQINGAAKDQVINDVDIAIGIVEAIFDTAPALNTPQTCTT